MTYRERRERRAERLEDWAAKREQKGTAALEAGHEALERIPFGQPIHVGHHSERADRNYRGRARAAIDRGHESLRTAESMSSRAAGIESQLERSIYDDDPDAIERLREKLERLEAERETIKQHNAAYRAEHKAELKGLTAYQRDQLLPHAGYELRNLGGNITRTRDRLSRLERTKANPEGVHDRTITARFASACARCGSPLEKGEQIRYSKTNGARCMDCPSGASAEYEKKKAEQDRQREAHAIAVGLGEE